MPTKRRQAATLVLRQAAALTLILAVVLLVAGPSVATGAATPSLPAAPGSLLARAGSGVATLTWKAPPTAPGPLLGFRVYRNAETAAGAPTGGSNGTERIATLPPSALSYLDYRVTNGHTYSYTVRAVYDQKLESRDAAWVSATPARVDLFIKLVLGSKTAWVNGAEVSLDAPAQLVGGKTTMVPLRFVGASLGASMDYDSRFRRITATLGGRVVRLWIDDTAAEIDGRHVTISAAPVLRSGRTLVPVRFLAEAFGALVHYDARTTAVTVSFPDTDADLAGATTLTVGASATGVLNGPRDVDVYRAAVTAGRTYRVVVSASGGAPQLVLVRLDPFRDPGAEFEVATGPDETQVHLRVQAADPAGANSGGSYRVLLEDRTEEQDTVEGAISLPVNGEPHQGTLHTASDVDHYSFEATAGQDYAISGGGETVLTLRTAAGAELMTDARPLGLGETGEDKRRLVWRCEETGLYVLTVGLLPGTPGKDAGAPYSVQVASSVPEEDEAISQAIRLRPDHDAADAWLSRADDQDWFAFEVTRGRRYYVQTYDPSPGCDTVLTLLDPSGTQFAASDDAPGFGEPTEGSLVSFVATFDGLAFARVTPYPPSLGRYTISATTAAAESDGRPGLATHLDPGVPPIARSLVKGDRDWFAFDVTRGQTYTLATSALRDGCDTDLVLYDPAWRLLVADDDVAPGDLSSSVRWTATFSGTVYALVSPVEGTGFYSVGLRTGP